MTHEIKTNGITILFVEVPEDATRFVTDWKFLIVDIFSPTQKMIPIPEGQYQILGKSTELSEEQMKEIITLYEGKKYKVYTGSYGKYTDKVQESYLSLLEANGIVDRDRNMIDKPNESDILEDCEDWVYARAKYQSLLEQWQESQSKVKHYLVLKMI